MNESILPICLALCLAGWAVSGASVEAQKTSPVCYICNDSKCATVESVYDHLTANLTLWSRGEMAALPPCPITSPRPSGKCLLCVKRQEVCAACASEIIKPAFEGQGSSMPVIKANCTGIVSTDQTGGAGGLAWRPDPNAPAMTPDGTGRSSKETRIAIVSIPILFLVIVIVIIILIVVLRRRTRSRPEP
ncbi:uncharacterized protein ACWYII_000617 isoform 2-T2 [Salvelinus alpinus]